MAKQLNVNLAFNADTSKAKAQLQDLQNTLNTLIKGSAAGVAQGGLPLTKDLMEAQIAADKLNTILRQSMNASTGNLDLTKFSDSLNKSGLKLEALKGQLESLGPTGQKAFMSLASSIISADVPLTRTNKLVSELWTTMKNTVRWQFSSSMLHSFIGTIQSAVGYAQDLNESLNNIRIVTGQNVDQMAAFAYQANKAAKALSTTTTAYTDAALIYYQQGLDDTQVKERTDITIKMANVSRQSAEEVSDQMTSIWNNFYNGSQSLEHFADVLTRLGADTASSSDEIAQGLEKFSSIANMIGLSFDNAAAALATVTATTRQSADVVGTAFKTIFARIQGLSLGETLDDGTNLNKYSKALYAVGIDIKEQNGELKDMDSILAEMGAKWNTLSKDQQVALAQTVAGVRQYNQLIALMDNFDFYQKNLSAAQNANGSLQEQADIYAESWEAARDRVKSAAQDIYDSILDDKFFITTLNGLEKLLSGIADVTDSLNGLPGILSVLGVVLTKVFSNQLSQSIERMAFNLRSLSGQTQKAADELRNIALKEASDISFNTGTAAGDLQGEQLKRRLELQNQIREVSKNMNADQKEQLTNLLQINDAYAQQAILAAEAQDKASDKAQDSRSNIRTIMRKNGASEQETSSGLINITKEMNEINSVGLTAVDAINKIDQTFDNTATSTAAFDKELDDVIKGLQMVGRNTAARSVEALRKKFNANEMSAQEFKKALLETVNAQDLMDDTALAAAGKLSVLQKKYHLTDAQCEEYANDLLRLAEETRKSNNANDAYAKSYENLKASISGFKGAMDNFGTSVVKGVQGISQIAMGINSLKAAWDTLNNEDMDFGEKLLSVTMSLTMAIPALIGGYQALKEAKLGEALASIKTAAAEMIDAASKAVVARASGTATAASGSLTFSLLAQAAAWLALKLSISPLLALLLVVTGAIAAVAAISFGLVKAFQYIKSNSPEGQLKTLKERADESAEAFNRVQEAVNATSQAIDNLDSSYETIKNLTKGTNEWYEAVTNVNAEVLKLLDQYPQLLSGHIFTTEDGILGIDEEGRNLIETENRMRLQAAQNINTSNQIAVKQKEIDNSYLNFKDPNSIISNSYDYDGTIAKAMQSFYENENVGEYLFTEEGSNALLEGLKQSAPSLFQDGYGNEIYVDPKDFYNTVMANQSTIRDNANVKDQIDIMQNTLIQSRAIAAGSNRNADEINSIMGENSYNDIKSNKLDEVKSVFGDWNDHINYQKGGVNTSDEEWKMIEDFMDLKGDNVEYVAQRNGKMVLEVDGEEIEYSKDEVYDAIAELYTGPDWESQFEKGLEESLKQSLNTSVEHLDLDDLTAIDNFRKSLSDALIGTDLEDSSDSIFKSVMDQWGTSEEGINAFRQDTQYIDFQSEAFLKQAEALNQGKINAEQFSAAIGELNAQGQLMAMGDYFSEAAKSLGLDDEAAQDMQDYAEHLRSISKDSSLLSDELADNADSAADLAVEITRMNKGIDTLADGFEEWKDILKKSSKESAEYAKAMKQTKSALSDVMDVEEDLISNDFVENHLEEISKAAEGDADAIDFLRSQMDEEIIANITLGQSDEFIEKIQAIDEEIKNNIPENIEVGAIINDGAFYEAAAKMVEEAGMTADEANAYFAGMGYEPVYNTEEIDNSAEVPNSLTKTSVESIDWEEADVDLGLFGTHQIKLPAVTTRTESIPEEPSSAPGVTRLTSFSGDGKAPPIAGLRKKATGSQNNYSSSNKGGKASGSSKGGGSSKKSAGKPKKTDVVDRYKEIEDKIDDIRNSADKASNAMDHLFGAKKIQKMQEVNKLLSNEVDLLKAKRNEAEKYLAGDEANLKQAVAKYGGSVKNVELVNGNIDNYEEILSALFDELYAATPEEGTEISDAQQEKIDAIQNRIDKIKEAISQYDETRELIEDLDNEIQDKLYEIQDRNFEILNYKLELKVEVDEAALKRLDYFLNKFSDDFYKMAESAALMQKQIPTYKSLIGSYDEYKTSLDTAYSKGKISQADYIEGLKQVRDGIYEQLEALNELDKQMLHYYEDTLSAATDELSDHTDHMEHLTSVFEHYQNLLSIIGKSKDYEAMGNFLQGQADTIKDRLSVAQSYYDVLLQQKDEIQAELEAAIASGDEAKIKMYQKEWDAIVDETDAAQEQVLSLTEQWAQAMKSVIQNNMEKIADTLEKTLTGGTTFDTLMDGFDKLNTRQEEYLTKTNQIYETNKLMRTASKALDETDNKVAKQKLKNFIDETKGLQETTQLSKYELEIQQAKYDLLLAQIALEEAQNAKSTVRLSRDNEGNFGYVYTADQNKIDDAQQGVDDANNKLYNLSLEGQQQYTEKYLQAEQAMYEELKQLQQDYLDGNIASEEEYELRKSQIQEHYLGPEGVLTTYSKLYNVAVQTDANATADYWGQEYGRMTQDTEAWKTAVNDYLLEIDNQIEEWKNVQTTANDEVGGALNNSKKATEELTIESRNLRDTINDEVIPAISDEIDAVREQTDAYADQRQKLLDLIATYEDYLKKLDATISANSIGFDKDTDYSALMNEYLSKGGKTSDDTYKQLLAQRNAKIDWLKTQGKDKSYWGTYGDDTTDMYDRLLSGENWINSKGQDMQKWFTADYVDDSKLTEIFETLGVPIEEIQTLLTDLKTSSDSTGEKIDATKETIQTSTDNINTKISETTESVNTKAGEIGDSINTKVGETTDNLNNTFNETKDILNEDINVFKDETINAFENIGQIIENGVESIVDSVNEAAGEISSSVGSGFSEVRGEISGLQSQINSLRSSQSIYGLASFDTGGYTGNWGPEGKLAMLHEKELILNENDTSNLLSTISFIRELVNMIDAQAASASLFNLMSTPSPNPNANTLEQKVEITAEFPNVNDRYEIEEAFNNLVNRASQYANKAF